MIWRRINGHSLLSRLVFLALFVILCLGFSLLSSTSDSYATNLPYQQYRLYYMPDRINDYGTFNTTVWRYSYYSADFIMNNNAPNPCYDNDCFNTNASRCNGTVGISRVFLQYDSVVVTNNAASLHFEYNIVMTGSHDRSTLLIDHLDRFGIFNVNKNVGYSSINTAVTDWTFTYNGRNFPMRTLTVYGDLALTGLTNGPTTIYLEFGTTDASPFMFSTTDTYHPNGYPFAVYSEQNPTDINFYDSTNEALQQAQINAINVTNQLIQRQYEQEQQDRLQLQNISSESNQDGSDASSNAENATSSILGAITGIYGQLLHPSTSDCVISGVQVYDLNLGNLDFCTGFTIPQPIFAVGGLIMIGLIILLSWSILKAGMSLYNDLLGGK